MTRLIIDTHDAAAFQALAHLTVGGFRDWLLPDEATPPVLAALPPGATPEMAAAVAKISRLQDLMVTAAKCNVVTRFRNTIGLPGRLSVRLRPNHPPDDPRGIIASIVDGLLSVPATRRLASIRRLTVRTKSTCSLTFLTRSVRSSASRRRAARYDAPRGE